jgi:hypothetical protein
LQKGGTHASSRNSIPQIIQRCMQENKFFFEYKRSLK